MSSSHLRPARPVAILVLSITVAAALWSTQVSAGAAATASVDWPTYGYDALRTGYNPNETVLAPGNVGSLTQKWAYELGAVTIGQPAVAAGVVVDETGTDLVYEGSEHGHLVALRVADGSVVWDRNLGEQDTDCYDMPDTIFGVSGTPTIDRAAGVLYETGGNGKVYSLDLATGATTPGWPVAVTRDPAHEHVYGGINQLGGKLYVATASYCDYTPYHGHIVQIDVATHARTASWFTVGRTVNGGGIWGPGGVAVDPATGHVFTATGNALYNPESYRFGEHVVELSDALKVLGANYLGLTGGDVDFGATPILYQAPACPPQVAAKNKSGVLVVYTRGGLNGGPTQRLQVGNVGDWQFNGIPAYSPVTNTMFIGNSSDSAPFVEGMVALNVQPDCSLALAWQNSVSDPGPWSSVSPPTVANGVVYYGNGVGNKEFAFDAATGTKLWDSGTTIGGAIFAAAAVVNGMVFVGSWDHVLHAYGL